MLTVDRVSYRYRKTTTDVLRGVSCDFDAGCLYGLVGRSGSGKTTLLSLLANFDIPTAGDILFEGKSLSAINVDEYRRRDVGVVFQGYNLIYAMTAVENVMLALSLTSGLRSSKALRQRALELLAGVGIDEATSSKRSLHISGGEQQRVSIARALAASPKVILADEPTGNLDPETGIRILDLLKKEAKERGTCVVIATHDEKITGYADRIYRMRDGVITETDSFTE